MVQFKKINDKIDRLTTKSIDSDTRSNLLLVHNHMYHVGICAFGAQAVIVASNLKKLIGTCKLS